MPVQLWRAADDQVLPNPYYAEAVRADLPIAPDFHVVPAAGHYDFLSPCPAALARTVPAICTSAPGFDRTAFHMAFKRDVVAFSTEPWRRGRSDRYAQLIVDASPSDRRNSRQKARTWVIMSSGT